MPGARGKISVKETLNLTASAATDEVYSSPIQLKRLSGGAYMILKPTVNSGTPQTLTVEAQVKSSLSGADDWAGTSAELNSIGTVTSAAITNGYDTLFRLSGLNWWADCYEEIRFRLSMASGTYDVDIDLIFEAV